MKDSIKTYAHLFWQLLKTDLLIFKQVLVEKIVDTTIWVVISLVIYAYILPELGLFKSYAPFYAIGGLISLATFETFPHVATFVADVNGNKTISYFLSLPIPSWLIFVKQVCGYALCGMGVTIIGFPLSKLLLLDKLDLSSCSWVQALIIFCLTNVLMGFVSLFMASIVNNMNEIGKIWTRLLFPLWFLGGTQFSWQTMYGLSPLFAYLSFLNPVLYLSEGLHAAVLGQEGYISFWLCVSMSIVFSLLIGYWAVVRIKKRLDFI